MKRKIETLIAGIATVLLLGAVASASASAATCTAGGLCIEGQRVGTETNPVPVPFTFIKKVGANPTISINSGDLTITCETLKLTGNHYFESPLTTMRYGMELGSCKARRRNGEEGCRVTEGAVFTDRLTGTFGYPRENLTVTGSPYFTEFGISTVPGKFCPSGYAGGWNVRGSIGCNLKQVEAETIGKELVCEFSKSQLEAGLGSYPIELGGLAATVELSGEWKGKKFSVK